MRDGKDGGSAWRRACDWLKADLAAVLRGNAVSGRMSGGMWRSICVGGAAHF